MKMKNEAAKDSNIRASLKRAYLRLADSAVRLGFMNARYAYAPIKSATQERRIGIMAAQARPIKRAERLNEDSWKSENTKDA